MNNKEKFQIRTLGTLIPAMNLGNFIDGYIEKNESFNYKNLWWPLLPIIGWVIFVLLVIIYFLKLLFHFRFFRVFIYEKGIVRQSLTKKGKTVDETVFKFNDLIGVSYKKTRQYKNVYGINIYNDTTVQLTGLDENKKEICILSGSYRNEKEQPGKYNFTGYACNAIMNVWNQIALERFDKELKQNGFAVFYSGNKEVKVGIKFLRMGNNYVSDNFSYIFDNGALIIYPNMEEGSHFKKHANYFSIDVNGMYNSHIFLMAIRQYLGINLS